MSAIHTGNPPVSLKAAESIFRRGTDCFGPEHIEDAFKMKVKIVPEISFTEAELDAAKKRGECLRLGVPITMKAVAEARGNKQTKGEPLLFNIDWCKDETFYTTDTVRKGWALCNKEVLPESACKNYLEQTDFLVEHVSNKIWTPDTVPPKVAEAIATFKKKRAAIEKAMNSDWKKAAEDLEGLAFNSMFRESPAEILYRLVLNQAVNGERSLENMYAWSNQRSSGSELVYVGRFGGDGAHVFSDGPGVSRGILGSSFFRSE